ncbi:MAG: polysaccharide deacetylase family protein [Acidobacteriota bacterium]|nr:polysaccharide deacetylase family protein [Acidobacteriota bacterium]
MSEQLTASTAATISGPETEEAICDGVAEGQRIYNPLMIASLLTAASLATAISTGYQSMAPTGRWFGAALNNLGRGSKRLALTYDDGPNDPHTLRLLEVLARHEVRATFFLIGRYVQQRPDIVREIVGAGHVVGNHTFNHPLLIFKSGAQIREEITACDRALSDAVGEHSRLFRPPFGGRRPAVFRIARQLGFDPVMWNVTGYDWNATSAEEIERKVGADIRGGDIILLHDGGHKNFGADRSHTVAASDKLITKYKAEGYQFVPLP